jgi:hypothetical protein
MKRTFRASESFWKKFYRLPPAQKERVRTKWTIFKNDPFNPRLGTHRINSLSAHYQRTIYSVVLEGDLRAVFFLEGETVMTIDIGTHDIYR